MIYIFPLYLPAYYLLVYLAYPCAYILGRYWTFWTDPFMIGVFLVGAILSITMWRIVK